MSASLQEHRWPLSAPESLGLAWGATGDTWALSLAILELAVRYRLTLRTLERRKLLLFKRSSLVLIGSLSLHAIASEPLRAVLTATPLRLRYDAFTTGIPIDTVSRKLLAPEVFYNARHRQRLRSGPVYIRNHVMPSLVHRGLYTHDFTTLPPVLTPVGKDALDELRHLLAIGRESLPTLVERDPDAALAYLDRASSALLLIRGLPSLVDRMVKLHGTPTTYVDSTGASRHQNSKARGVDTQVLSMPSIPAGALLRSIGPGSDDDLDVGLHAITTEVERQWAETHRRISTVFGFGE